MPRHEYPQGYSFFLRGTRHTWVRVHVARPRRGAMAGFPIGYPICDFFHRKCGPRRSDVFSLNRSGNAYAQKFLDPATPDRETKPRIRSGLDKLSEMCYNKIRKEEEKNLGVDRVAALVNGFGRGSLRSPLCRPGP